MASKATAFVVTWFQNGHSEAWSTGVTNIRRVSIMVGRCILVTKTNYHCWKINTDVGDICICHAFDDHIGL